MSEKDEQRFRSSNKYWICDKLLDVGDNKVKDHRDITGKYRGSAHWSCNIKFKLTKKVPVILHNLRGYYRHLIIKGIGKIKMNTMSDYHDLYFKTHDSLLVDVFEKFINTCLEYYRLDPCHYFSSPGLSWDAMLKMTGIELKFASDIHMHLLIEKRMRGGIFYIAKRYSKANNKYMQSHDANNPSK